VGPISRHRRTVEEKRHRILVADDQRDVIEALRMLLERHGYEVLSADSPERILDTLEAGELGAVIMDLNYTRDTTSGREGLDLLASIRTMDADLPVVVMTAWGTVEGAVDALRRGARDYVQKPWDNDRLIATLGNVVELGRALRRTGRLEDLRRRTSDGLAADLIAESRSMAPVLRLIERIGPSDANVLITGEHGTGKEVVARALHAASPRAGSPMVVVNAGAVSEGVFESELFGHVRGAFTDARADRAGCFELADGGTLMLDEIGNMPISQQPKLLRAVQTGEIQRVGSSRVRRVDVRLVSATNVDIDREVSAGRFREDLLYRLNTVEIRLPPLRERREDISLLAAHFLEAATARYRREIDGFSGEAMDALLAHPWPGNVRELEHTVERALLLARGARIELEDLWLRRRGESTSPIAEMTLAQAERHLIESALERCGGNVAEAAESLGLSRSALYRRLQRHGIGEGRE
jgi:DNA-binding NtrC family response regulator